MEYFIFAIIFRYVNSGRYNCVQIRLVSLVLLSIKPELCSLARTNVAPVIDFSIGHFVNKYKLRGIKKSRMRLMELIYIFQANIAFENLETRKIIKYVISVLEVVRGCC